jgi:hypothetical protein
MNELDIQTELQLALEDIAKQILDVYRRQVPSPSNNPDPSRLRRTGRLRSSLGYRVLSNNTISIYFNRYGIYPDFGTGSLFNQGAANTTNPFGLPAYREYERGFGGIRPQYWTSLSSEEDAIVTGLEEQLSTIIEEMVRTTTVRNVQVS